VPLHLLQAFFGNLVRVIGNRSVWQVVDGVRFLGECSAHGRLSSPAPRDAPKANEFPLISCIGCAWMPTGLGSTALWAAPSGGTPDPTTRPAPVAPNAPTRVRMHIPPKPVAPN